MALFSGLYPITLAIMGARRSLTAVTFAIVAVICITLGLAGAVVGGPVSYRLTTEQALHVLDARPLMWTSGWVVYAVVVLALAIVRALLIPSARPAASGVALRGSVWLWGAIGAPWLFVWMAWDLQLDGLYDHDAQSTTFVTAMWWWLSAIACLLIAIAWSAWVASRPEPRVVEQMNAHGSSFSTVTTPR